MPNRTIRHAINTTLRSTLAVLLWLAVGAPAGLHAASAPSARGTGGAVASGDPRATAAGIEVLEAGGNAADAAVATALALAVAFPEAGNLGGGGFAVVRLPATRAGGGTAPASGRPAGAPGEGGGPEPRSGREGASARTGSGAGGAWELASLDFREVGPAAASRDMYLDGDGEAVPDASLVGPLAAGVPGSPAGLHALHERFGRLPWARVVEPAERLAREGFLVDANLHGKLADARELLARFPETAAVWLPEGEPPPVGTRIRLPGLAATLRAYAEEGPEAITRGPVAERVEAVSRRHGGVLGAADLAAYRPAWREAVTFSAFGWDLASMGLPSSGAAILGGTFGVLERLGWAELPRFGADRAHLLAEAFRGAFADRFLLGDPAAAEVTEDELLAPAWLARRSAGIDRERATPSKELTAYPGRRPRETAASEETTHLSVVDAEGGAVALTTTLNGLFGSKVWVPGFGFLNNEMDDFTTVPGEPNMFGLVQGKANAVGPGKRMLSSMSPTVAWRGSGDATEVVALGGRGGSRIPTNTAQVLLNLLVDGDHLQLALDRPRLHHQWLPDRLDAEPDALAPESRSALEARGHVVEVVSGAAKVHAVRLLPDGSVMAAVDPRSTGSAAVVEPAFLVPAPRRAGALAAPPSP